MGGPRDDIHEGNVGWGSAAGAARAVPLVSKKGLMRNLKIWQKLLLLGAVLMVPFAVVTYRMVASIDELGVDFARQEARGIEVYRPLLSLVRHLQQHRGMSNAWLNGDLSFKPKVDAKGAEIETDLRNVDRVDGLHGAEFQTRDKWASLSRSCKELLSRTRSLTPQESFALHSQAIASAITLISDVGDASKL